MRSRTRVRAVGWLALALLAVGPQLAAAAEHETFKPENEFALKPYVPINIGPLDLSINKAVIYMLMSAVIACVGCIWVIRGGLKLRPTRAQNIVELVYEFAETTIARTTLPAKVFARWFPYIATLFVFILINNVISFIPLPFSSETGWGGWAGSLPNLGLYAATSNISVTLALTLMTFLFTHVEGVRQHGPLGYWNTLKPQGVKGVTKGFVFALELLGQILRLVSLSVRLFANMLAGHLLILMAAGFAVLLGNFAGLLAIPFGVFFYFFEWVLVAGLQAFIFAMLSGIYIGFAAEAPH
ncbi:MAG: F0F1 ATP synthase subunit A [Actinobacteria bacterium]|nr:F0F1 ATP synthase subunit A [Actinomycetota bacterium]